MRRFFTIFSVAGHAIAIVAILVAQVFAVGPLPTPRDAALVKYTPVKLVDIELQAPLRRSSDRAPASTSGYTAPIVVPRGIADETGLEGATRATDPSASLVGVEHGIGSVDGLGRVERVPPPSLPPPPPPPQVPVRLHAGMESPRKVTSAAPVYPPVAQVARVQGVVILDAIIDAQGVVTSVRVLRSIPLLDQAAVDAVGRWRYTPARLNGVAVPVIMTVTISFTLDR